MKLLQYFGMVIAAAAAVWSVSTWNIPGADISEELRVQGFTIEEIEEREAAMETARTEETTQPEPVTHPQPQSATVRGFSDDDKYLLIRVAWLEAGNQGWEGMAAVMNVIINRAERCGASIRDIVYSPGQFDGVTGMIDTCTPGADAETALWAVMQGWDVSQGALYFCSPAHNGWHSTHLTYLFTGWGHEFYK